jgi:hypothetical protein
MSTAISSPRSSSRRRPPTRRSPRSTSTATGISADEFTQLYLEFFGSEDPDTPGNWFWGPFE